VLLVQDLIRTKHDDPAELEDSTDCFDAELAEEGVTVLKTEKRQVVRLVFVRLGLSCRIGLFIAFLRYLENLLQGDCAFLQINLRPVRGVCCLFASDVWLLLCRDQGWRVDHLIDAILDSLRDLFVFTFQKTVPSLL